MAVKTNDLVCFNCSSKNGGGRGDKIWGTLSMLYRTYTLTIMVPLVLFSMLSCLARLQKILGAADQGL